MRIALATAEGASDISNDDPILAEALHRHGAEPEIVRWDASADWPSYDAVVVRTVWDYQFRLSEFQDWTERMAQAVRVVNDPRLICWNIHKAYLLELEAKGVPIVPTRVIGSQEEVRQLADSIEPTSTPDWVLKPEVGASGGDTFRTSDLGHPDWRRQLSKAAAAGKVLVQDYMRSIESEGELSIVWIAGTATHAIRKNPGPGQFLVHVEHGGRNERVEIPAEGEGLARQCIATLPVEPTFARVDLVRDEAGCLRLMELELIEPELMFEWAPEAADALAKALLAPSSFLRNEK